MECLSVSIMPTSCILQACRAVHCLHRTDQTQTQITVRNIWPCHFKDTGSTLPRRLWKPYQPLEASLEFVKKLEAPTSPIHPLFRYLAGAADTGENDQYKNPSRGNLKLSSHVSLLLFLWWTITAVTAVDPWVLLYSTLFKKGTKLSTSQKLLFKRNYCQM